MIGEKFSFQPELQYSRQGYFKSGTTFGNATLEINFITEYLNFVPLARFDLGKSNTKFLLLVGPNLGFWIGEKELQKLYDNGKVKNYELHITNWDDYNRFEIGITAGVGISHTFKNYDQFIFDTRLTYGFNGVKKNISRDNNQNNLYNSISIGYLYSFNR